MNAYRFPFALSLAGLVLFAWGCAPANSTRVASSGGANTTAAVEPSMEVDIEIPAASQATAEVAEVAKSASLENAVPATNEAEVTEVSTLTIGDPAPPLSIAHWVTGEAISKFQPEHVYVVEFWATWCPPCRTSMPHLSKLQEQYDGQAVFVGISDEELATVESFLNQEQSAGKTWREVVSYRLAIDANDATTNAYMRAASQNGIPCAFVVGRSGRVEWIGHPMTMDEPLAKIVAGDWDVDAALAEFRQEQRVDEIQNQLGLLFRAEKWDEALAKLADLEAEVGVNANINSLKLHILQAAGRNEEAAALQAQLVEQRWNNANALNEIAWGIATGDGERDLALALKAAQRANELTEEQDGSILDTLARVYFELGDVNQALQWQRKAVEHGDGQPEILEALKRYEQEAGKANKPAEATQPAPPADSAVEN